MTATKHTIIDLFCGTGAFAHGFLAASDKFHLAYAIDSDPIASATSRANHRTAVVQTEDIRNRTPKSVRNAFGLAQVDVIIGGPPCQGFSSLRPQRSSSREDDRNNLYLQFASYVKFFRPKALVLENVIGLITHKNGETLDRVLCAFDALGYRVDWKILNAASYGVPQKRERFIMIGARDHAPVRFPTPTHRFSGKSIGHHDKGRFLRATNGCPAALTVNDAISDLPPLSRGQELTTYGSRPHNPYQQAMRATAQSITLHKAAHHSDKMMKVIRRSGESKADLPPGLVTSGFSSCYSRLNGNEPSTTITVKFQSPASSKCIHPTQHRTITPREAARIQSFDDNYVLEGPLTRVASQLGNAVPPLLGKAIAGAVLKMLQ
jgi:DNA (cytosine-5)-methyltransferase 1